jgi:hypothetical protein
MAMSANLTITIPDPLLKRLNRLAQAAQRPIEEVVVSTLNESIPAPPKDLPSDVRDELMELEVLSDSELLEVAHASMRPDEIPPTPYAPGDATDLFALRKAYALALLKWRGHSLNEIQGLAG